MMIYETETDLTKAIEDTLIRMYEEAEPSLDLEEFVDTVDQPDEDWFKQHRLSKEKQEEIREEILDNYNLSKREKMSFRVEVMNYSPSFPEDEQL